MTSFSGLNGGNGCLPAGMAWWQLGRQGDKELVFFITMKLFSVWGCGGRTW